MLRNRVKLYWLIALVAQMFFQILEYNFEIDICSTVALLVFILGSYIQVAIIPSVSETPYAKRFSRCFTCLPDRREPKC